MMRDQASAICDTALPAGEAPAWVHLLPSGATTARDGRRFILAEPEAVIAAFEAGRIDLPVDYEHQADKPVNRANGPVPAAVDTQARLGRDSLRRPEPCPSHGRNEPKPVESWIARARSRPRP